MFGHGRRWFTAGCITLLVVALLHTLGNTLSTPPTEAEYIAMEASMRDYIVPLGLGMAPSMWDIYRSLVFTMSLCLVGLGVVGLAIVSAPDVTPRLLSRVALVFASASLALTCLYVVYQVTPALISLLVVTVLFVIAAVPRRAASVR
jgi:hypothetical protein